MQRRQKRCSMENGGACVMERQGPRVGPEVLGAKEVQPALPLYFFKQALVSFYSEHDCVHTYSVQRQSFQNGD